MLSRAVAVAALAALVAALWQATPGPPAQPAGGVRLGAGLLSGRSVALDPGHGGPDPGAVGPSGVLEKHVVLSVGLRLRRLLEVAGATVYITRTEDRDLSGDGGLTLRERWRASLRRRVELIREWAPDAVISIHANAFPSRRWSGAQVFYSPGGHPLSRTLALSIQEELVHITGRTARQPSSHIEHYVLEHTEVPAVTVEVGFLSNPEEERLLADPAYQDRLAWAIFVGTAKYFYGLSLPAQEPGARPAPGPRRD